MTLVTPDLPVNEFTIERYDEPFTHIFNQGLADLLDLAIDESSAN